MLCSICHSCGTERVAAEMVAASSNHSDGRAAPAALSVMVSNATATASHRRTVWTGRRTTSAVGRWSTEMLTLAALSVTGLAKTVTSIVGLALSAAGVAKVTGIPASGVLPRRGVFAPGPSASGVAKSHPAEAPRHYCSALALQLMHWRV